MTICLLLGIKSGDSNNDKPDPVKLLCPLKLLGLESPGGITGAYHYTNMQRLELQLTKEKVLALRKSDEGVIPVRIAIEVEGSHTGRLGLVDLPNVTSLNISRMKEDLRSVVLNRWQKIGGDADLFTTATNRPYLFKELRKSAAFKHIALFIYPVWIDNTIITMGSYYGDPEKVVLTPHS
jgi:hypothetical protein